MAGQKKNAPASSDFSPRPWLFRGVFLHLGLSPLLFWCATVEPFDYPKSVLLQVGSALALGWMWAGAGRPTTSSLAQWLRELAKDPLAKGCLLFGASAILSTASSISPRTSVRGMPESFAGLPTLLAGVVLFFATRAACRSWLDVRGLLLAPVIAGSVASSYALVQAAGLDAFLWARVAEFGGARPFGTLGNANALSSFLAAVWPIQVCLSLRARRQGRRALSIVFSLSAATGALAIIRSASRAGWLGLLVGIVGVLLLLFAVGEKRLAARSLLVLTFGALVVLSLAGLLPGGPDLLATLHARVFGSLGYGSRQFLWTSAFEIFLKYPFFGSGVDTFGLAFSPLRTPEFWAIEWNTTFVRAHNEGLQVLATQGSAGAVALVMMSWGVWRAARSAWRRLFVEERLVLGGILVAILCLLPQMLVGLLHTAPAVLLISLAALVSAAERVAAAQPAPASFRHLLGLTRTLTALAPLILLLNAEAWQGRPISQMATLGAFGLPFLIALVIKGRSPYPLTRPGEPEVSPDRVPVRRSSYLAAAAISLLLALLFTYPRVAANAATARGMRLMTVDPIAALGSLERAVRLDPGSAASWARLGQSAQMMATKDAPQGPRLRRQAREALDRAAILEPMAGQYKMLRCRVIADQARADQARADQARADQARADQAGAAEATREEVAFACDQAVESEPFNPYFKTAAVNAAVQLGDLARARRIVEAALTLYPGFGPLQYQLGFIALQQARLEEAERVLTAAINGEWHGQLAGRQAAHRALEEARRRLGIAGENR